MQELKTEVAALKVTVERQQKLLDQLLQQKVTEPVAAASAPAVAPAGSSALPATSAKVVTAGWDANHRPGLRTVDGAYELNLGGFAHFDLRGYESGAHPANTFLVRRARLFVDGRLARYFEYKVEADFADTSSTILRDGWVRVHRVDPFQFQVGQFKEPFSQEELRTDQAQDFVERSMVNNLAPSRSPGFMFQGVIGKGVFEYYTGLFNGKGLLASNTTGTPESVLRLRATPGKHSRNDWFNQLSFGGAAAVGRNAASGANSIRGRTESQSQTFFTPDTVAGSYYRVNGELNWLKGPAAVRSEYGYVSQNRAGLGGAGTDLPVVESRAFMAQATYLLTGERKPHDGAVVPRHNLFDESGGHSLGAFELKFRYAFQDMNDHTAKANRASSYTFGTNWYMNRFVKNVLDIGIEHFRDPVRTPNPGDQSYFVILNRVQLAF